MGGKDDDNRSDFDRMMGDVGKELAKTRKELERVMEELRDELPNINDASDDFRKQVESDSESKRGAFERFKGFVDSNFAVLSHGFKNFPTNVRDLKLRMQEEREARQAEEVDIWRRWTGSEDSPDHIKMQVERASQEEKDGVKSATFMLLRESFERNKHVPGQKILDLYRDDEWSFGSLDQFATPMLSFGGACYYKAETMENLPSTARWGWPLATHKWLSVEWFKRCPYSPIRLEAHPNLTDKGEKWRAAFEDLLLVSLDKPMQTTEKVGQRIPYGMPQSTYHGPGLDWMLSLQCRGILPPQLPNLYRNYSHQEDKAWFKPPHTSAIPDLDIITRQWAHPMSAHAERDIKVLVEELGIQAQPETNAFSQTQLTRIPQSPWQVPDTEAELYEQMQPQLPADESSADGGEFEDSRNVLQALDNASEDGNFLAALTLLHDYELRHGRSDVLLDTIIVHMEPKQIDDLWERLLMGSDEGDRLRRFEDRVLLHERWQTVFDRAEKLGWNVGEWHARGAPLEQVEAELDDYEHEAKIEKDETNQRMERALARAEKLGYDFKDWDWNSLPLEELEAELEREEAYTAARRRGVLAKAAKLGYDFNGWEYEGLPVQELEDEMLRMELYAKRDAQQLRSPVATAAFVDETKRPDVLSQLTTTETVRMPNGTVTTKVVLKRRFVDGREETKETVHTSNEMLEAKVAEKATSREEQGKPTGKGWFWT